MKMTRSFISTLASFFAISTIIISPVFAQYDVNIIEPRYDNGREVFGIDTDGDQTISFYSEGCKSVERVVIELKGSVSGEITVFSHGEESPIEGKEIEKTFEYCNFVYDRISKDDIEKISIDSRVRKSWLDVHDVDENDIGLYTFNNDEWSVEGTNKESDNAIYSFYTSDDVEFSEYVAVSEHIVSSPLGVNPFTLIICCIVFLLLLLLFSVIYSILRRRDNNEEVRN